MHVAHTFQELSVVTRKVHLAIGAFDGLHIGHQRVIGQAREDASAAHGSAVVLTFDPHPARVLRPETAPPLITSTAHKLRLLESLGVDACLALPFTPELSQLAPREFIERVAAGCDSLEEICVGSRFRFGHDRSGDVAFIANQSRRLGFRVREIPPVEVDGEMVSSTAIRQHIQAGALDRASMMLGRPYSLLGTVEHGDGRGKTIGFPTANLDPHSEVLPPDGVYAVSVRIGIESYRGVLNIGLRPTFAHQHRTVEAHLIGSDMNLYGQDLEVVFAGRIRDEHKFESVDALRAQIQKDIEAAQRLLG